jgi:hypothetical protein
MNLAEFNAIAKAHNITPVEEVAARARQFYWHWRTSHTQIFEGGKIPDHIFVALEDGDQKRQKMYYISEADALEDLYWAIIKLAEEVATEPRAYMRPWLLSNKPVKT